MPHTITRQHRTFHKGTWQPTSCTTTVTNPVGQQLTPTCSTRGGKREQNLHAEGCSSPSKPSAGGRASGRRSRRVRNRRTGTLEIIGPSPETFAQLPLPSAQPSIIPHPSPSQRQAPPTHPPTPPPPKPPAAATREKTRQKVEKPPPAPVKIGQHHRQTPHPPRT